MAVEIERKFLVRGSPWEGHAGTVLHQGYIAREDGRTVRVRISGDHAWLTLKGPGAVERLEFEYEIPRAEAAEMLSELCPTGTIHKIRYRVPVGEHTFEVDVFEGSNAGLVLAEVELRAADQHFVRPDWLREEVTDDPRYANAHLIDHPWPAWGGEGSS